MCTLFGSALRTAAMMLVLALVPSCVREGSAPIPDRQASFFPLHLGNEWQYVCSQRDGDSLTLRVVDQIDLDGKTYEVLQEEYRWSNGKRQLSKSYMSCDDTMSVIRIPEVRNDDIDNIAYVVGNSPLVKWYDFAAKPGDTWNGLFGLSPDGRIATTAKVSFDGITDSIVIRGRVFDHCLQFKIDVGDLSYDDLLAKGVGLIKRETMWGSYELVKANLEARPDGSWSYQGVAKLFQATDLSPQTRMPDSVLSLSISFLNRDKPVEKGFWFFSRDKLPIVFRLKNDWDSTFAVEPPHHGNRVFSFEGKEGFLVPGDLTIHHVFPRRFIELPAGCEFRDTVDVLEQNQYDFIAGDEYSVTSTYRSEWGAYVDTCGQLHKAYSARIKSNTLQFTYPK